MTSIHKRKSSKEEDENAIAPNGRVQSNGSLTAEGKESQGDFPPRNCAVSSPSGPSSSSPHPPQLPSTRPPRNGLSLPLTQGYAHSASSLRPAFSTPSHLHLHGGSHSRMRSISSGAFAPASPSPLSMSFPSQHIPSSPTNARINTNSHSQPSLNGVEPPPSPSASTHSRRHSRLHSRNLSLFFPRPGSLPHSTIAEDGAQELEIGPPSEDSSPAIMPMPSASPTIPRPMQRLGEGFTFGGRPPPNVNEGPLNEQAPLSRTSRRGHHH